MTITTREQSIDQAVANRDELARDLEQLPPNRRGTLWERDRIAALTAVERTIARLVGRPQADPDKPARPTHGTCRLELTINGQVYGVRPIDCTEDHETIRAWRLRKAGTSTAYDAAETVHGLTCDCPDFTFHRDGIDPAGCKHCKALAAVGLLTGPDPDPEPEPDGEGFADEPIGQDDDGERLSLAAVAYRHAREIRSGGERIHELMGDWLDDLGRRIGRVGASTVDEYRDRWAALDAPGKDDHGPMVD